MAGKWDGCTFDIPLSIEESRGFWEGVQDAALASGERCHDRSYKMLVPTLEQYDTKVIQRMPYLLLGPTTSGVEKNRTVYCHHSLAKPHCKISTSNACLDDAVSAMAEFAYLYSVILKNNKEGKEEKVKIPSRYRLLVPFMRIPTWHAYVDLKDRKADETGKNLKKELSDTGCQEALSWTAVSTVQTMAAYLIALDKILDFLKNELNADLSRANQVKAEVKRETAGTTSAEEGENVPAGAEHFNMGFDGEQSMAGTETSGFVYVTGNRASSSSKR
jgi:hypothetical protein